MLNTASGSFHGDVCYIDFFFLVAQTDCGNKTPFFTFFFPNKMNT